MYARPPFRHCSREKKAKGPEMLARWYLQYEMQTVCWGRFGKDTEQPTDYPELQGGVFPSNGARKLN
jgi:hypothetical protein